MTETTTTEDVEEDVGTLCWCGRDDRPDEHEWQPGCGDPFPDTGPVSLSVMLSIPGITYRRLDYWVRRGLLRPANPHDGSGTQRGWTGRDYRLATAILGLTTAGLALDVAAAAAVAYVDEGVRTFTVGSVTFTWEMA
jgi:hypothetical protein